jgi:RNA polymerase sigma factor (sigma-70 family)
MGVGSLARASTSASADAAAAITIPGEVDAARTSPLPEDVAQYIDPSTNGVEGRIVDRVTMARALTEVGPKCRETLRMYYAEGYSAAEIAARLGTSSGYVMQLLHTCRKKVREAYDLLKAKRQEKT